MSFEKKLFTEMRIVALPLNQVELSDEGLQKALTLNTNLASLGLTFKPQDVARLATSSSLDTLFATLKEYVGEVKAEPMYPDFPNQVMEMDEAVFRFHQMIHYFSTYGIEFMTGMKTERGWLPEMKKTEKTESDDALLDLKVIGLIDDGEKYEYAISKVLSKRERMTAVEKEMVKDALPHVDAGFLKSLSVPFKQNLFDVFVVIFDTYPDEAVNMLHSVCKHTGDVLKCMDYLLTRKRYHLHTSEKRRLVKLLESYDARDLEANLILSGKKADRHKVVLQFIDYNEYSRSPQHKEAVRKLRNDELKSWESKVKALIGEKSEETLPFVAERPGMLLRMLTLLYRNGYNAEQLTAAITSKAEKLSTQTLVTTLEAFGGTRNKYAKREEDEIAAENRDVFSVLECALKANLETKDTPLKGKKVFFDMKDFDLSHSALRPNNKSDLGGYIQSGIAWKIPEEAKKIRFFVYWNDKERVDVDLHAFATTSDGKSIHVGWNDDFKKNGIVHSGDITHSDAAEYIDVDLENNTLSKVGMNIHLYSGKGAFKDIDTCFVGMMAVNKAGEKVKLYDPKNCMFSHNMKSPARHMGYGILDVKNRYMRYEGVPIEEYGRNKINMSDNKMSLQLYMDVLFNTQGVQVVENKEEADIVLTMGKSTEENGISLVDNNYFLD